MTNVDLTTINRAEALKVCQTVFGMDTDEAQDFLDLARGEVTTKAQTRYPKGHPLGGKFKPKSGGAKVGRSTISGSMKRAVNKLSKVKTKIKKADTRLGREWKKPKNQLRFATKIGAAAVIGGLVLGSIRRKEVSVKARRGGAVGKIKRIPKGSPKGGQFAAKIGGYGGAALAGAGRGFVGAGASALGQAVGKRYGASAAFGATIGAIVAGQRGLNSLSAGSRKLLTKKRDQERAEKLESIVGKISSVAGLAYRFRKPIGAMAGAAFRGARKGMKWRASYNRSVRRGAEGYRHWPGGDKVVDAVDYTFRETEVKEIPSTLTVFKEADGNYRWALLSSNGYRDRDGQIISTKALERDTALWELEGSPTSPLRFWHVALDDEHQKGLELGLTDFRMVHGRTLIESGTFLTKEIGEGVYNAQDQLAASVGFRHSKSEPDADGVFENVHIFERSLLPKGNAANLLTQLVVTE